MLRENVGDLHSFHTEPDGRFVRTQYQASLLRSMGTDESGLHRGGGPAAVPALGPRSAQLRVLVDSDLQIPEHDDITVNADTNSLRDQVSIRHALIDDSTSSRRKLRPAIFGLSANERPRSADAVSRDRHRANRGAAAAEAWGALRRLVPAGLPPPTRRSLTLFRRVSRRLHRLALGHRLPATDRWSVPDHWRLHQSTPACRRRLPAGRVRLLRRARSLVPKR